MIPEDVSFKTVSVQRGEEFAPQIAVKAQSEQFADRVAGYSVEVIADSVNDADSRLTTFVMRFPRCVLSEVNTHRVFSRNSASSRAKSLKVTLTEVMEAPYIPIFTENRRGMSGNFLNEAEQRKAVKRWLQVRDATVAGVISMLLGKHVSAEDVADNYAEIIDGYYRDVYLAEEKPEESLNLHKQNANRLLEPFMWHEAVVSATEWQNFLELRDEEEADPAIHVLGRMVRLALDGSAPSAGAILHAPFAPTQSEDSITVEGLTEALNISSGASAQVSYRPVGSGNELRDPGALALRLLGMKHMSPFEHGAVALSAMRELGWERDPSSNFDGSWVQYREIVENGGLK